MTAGTDAVLAFRTGELLKLFEFSLSIEDGAVRLGGPGCFPVTIQGDRWLVGLTPTDRFTVQQRSPQGLSYWLTHDGVLTKTTQLSTGPVPVTRPGEVMWLFNLVNAADFAEWGAELNLDPCPGLLTERL